MTLFKGFIIIFVVIIISYLFPLISTHPSFTDISCHSKNFFFSFPNFHCYIFCKSHDPLHILLNCYNRSPMDQQPSFSALTLFRSRIQHLSKQSIITMRQELFQVLNGDAFCPISSWPNEYQLLFWKKPIGDVDTFKLFLFFVGNGCSPQIITEWILTSQFWNNFSKGDKRSRQLDFLTSHLSTKSNQWFYFDLHHNMWLHLNGDI